MNFDQYQIGKPNKLDREIDDIFFRAEGKYIIYSCKDGPSINFDGDEKYLNRISYISMQLAKIEILTHKMENNELINMQLVYAISTAAEDNLTEATEIINSLQSKIISLKKNKNKIHYLFGTLSIIALLVTGLIITNLLSAFFNTEIWTKYIVIAQIATVASFGGFLSIMLKLSALEIDLDGDFSINFINGASRILISSISGISVYFLIKSNIILGAINQSESNYAIYVFAIISGFSEKFVPNLFSKIENDSIVSEQGITKTQ